MGDEGEMMAHDFKRFPELHNAQMSMYYFDSPHPQIVTDFDANVVKIVDGDTIRVTCAFRDFDFPVRFSNIMAAENSEEGGERSKKKLTELIMGADVEILVDPNNRVGKFGRILGRVQHRGFDIGEEMMAQGFAIGVWQEQMGIKDLELLGVI